MSGGTMSQTAERITDIGEINAILSEIRHYLPYQGPIKDFIADNILYGFRDQQLSFHEALRKASRLYGSLEYRPIAEYRRAYSTGKITDFALDFVLAAEGGEPNSLRHKLFDTSIPAELRRKSFRQKGYLYQMASSVAVTVEEQVHPTLFRLLASYLDQGMAQANLAERAGDFWDAMRKQFAVQRIYGISRSIAQTIISETPESALVKAIGELLPAGADLRTFLLEILVAARGWSGIIAQVEVRPKYLNYSRTLPLLQYVALYVVLLADRLKSAGYNAEKLNPANENADFFTERAPEETESEKIYRLWHDALEMSFYFGALTAVDANAPKKRQRSSRAGSAEFQLVFCIDDREESIRRHLEEVTTAVETFGAPGFFGIDMVYQGAFDAISIKHCPFPVTPRHKVRGVMRGKRKLALSRHEMNFWHRHGNNLFFGTLISMIFGLASLLRMAFSIHLPSKSYETVSPLSSKEGATELQYERPEGEAQKGDYFEGYTVTEMADRVGNILTQIGLKKDFGSLVVMVAHGSSSTNNPFFAAYDCGACSGRPGYPNARAFALMANRADVRAILKERGFEIPESTLFIGALHDTTRDEVDFVDEDRLTPQLQEKLKELKGYFAEALRRTAYERVRRFVGVPFPPDEESAVKEVVKRSEMLFEPRPEYTHATNAMGIVAPRSLSENLFLDRRSFFNSYDPAADSEGKVLSAILTPFVPVCGGINLAYYFSYLDSAVFGAGSKLPHNVFSLIGVGNGVDGDLRSGLPLQMTEIHEPIRFLLLIEQTREIVLKVFESNAAVYAWIKMDWVKCCVYDYEKQKYFWFQNGNFVELKLPPGKAEVFPESRHIFRNKRGIIDPAVVSRSA